MSFEDIQQQWQLQNQRPQPRVDAGLLLQEIRRNQRSFQAALFWRDFRELAAAAFVVVTFFGRPIGLSAAGVGLFILVDRLLQRHNRPSQSDDLKTFIELSLRQWRHQIWLLKNLLWWYLLPITIPMLVSFSIGADSAQQAAWLCGTTLLLSSSIYWLNQNAVKKYLIPRRLELEKLLADLSETGCGHIEA